MDIKVDDINGKESKDDIELADFFDATLVSKLDSLKTIKNVKYSELYIGGVYSLREKNIRENPDWRSQSANSFREILYILQRTESLALEKLLNDHFSKSLTPQEMKDYKFYLGNLYKLFNDLTHHFSEVADISKQKYLINKNLEIGVDPLSKEDYFIAIKFYKEYLKLLVVTALEMHQRIDLCVKKNQQDVDLVRLFFNSSRDSKIYFLSLIDESWLQWLWTNCFFVDLKKPSEDLTRFSYQLPELEYLTRMAEKDPVIVAKIINSIPISDQTFNPEVVDRFFWITGLLPVEQIKTILPKILEENWVKLMSLYNRSGYEYKQMVEKFVKEKDFDAINKLTEIVLMPRILEDKAKIEKFSISDKLFYLNDVSETDLFDAVTDSINDKKEESLKIVLDVLTKVVKLGEKIEGEVFSESEPFSLYLSDVDLFELELDGSKRTHPREDAQNFVATAKILIDNVFSSVGENEPEIKRLYTSYVSSLPDSRTTFRLKLFAITRFPNFFKKEIEDALFRVFNVGDRYSEIDNGAEYHHALIAGFDALDEKKREYVKNVFSYYGASLNDKSKEKWRRRDGLEILTFIKDKLTEPEIQKSKELFGDFSSEVIAPHADISHMRSGAITPRSPVSLADFTVDEIVEHLKTDLSPSVLNEQFKNDDFFAPRGTEGLGDSLREDFKIRPDEYIDKIDGFFDREKIDPSYIYALLRGVDEMLRNKKVFNNNQYILLINFFNLIRLSGENVEFKKSDNDSWLADWITVHKMMTDVLLNILGYIKDSEPFKQNRDLLFSLVKYLLSIKCSPDANDDKRESSEPSHIALNSVRGQAFRAFVQFIYNESNKTLADDVKILFEEVLDNDSSNAVRFTLGEFLPAFYFRDIQFTKKLLPKIFPKGEIDKEKLYFATWEGYLAGPLHKELFEELKEYYIYAITLKTEDYPDRKYLKGLDETLAGHIALAYAHFELKPSDPLFDLFWNTPNETRHYEFASFIGRHYLTRDRASDEWLEEIKVNKQKLIDFWTWILTTNVKIEAKTFSGFGFWINPGKELIKDETIVEKISATLKKSNGEIDWDYGLMHRIKNFAEINPERTLDIMKSLLILNDTLNPHHRIYFDASNQFKEPLEIIYKNDKLKKPVEDFINLLIEKGSSIFWGLKEVIKDTGLDAEDALDISQDL